MARRPASPARRPARLDTGPLARAARRGPHWAASALLGSIFLFVAAFVIWAAFAELDQVTTGPGRVIPSGQVQVVQNLEGGIVAAILVREGETVEEGQVLLQLDPTTAAASFRGDRAEYLGLIAARARLDAEIAGEVPTFPDEVVQEAPHLVRSETALYQGRQAQLQAAVDVLERQAEQKRQELRELRSRAASLGRAVALAREELRITEPNVAAGITSRVELLRLQRDVNELDGQLRETRLAIPRAESAIAEAEQRIAEKREEFQAEALDRASQIAVRLGAKTESLRALQDRVERTEVRAPVSGIVKTVTVNTIGGVVQPGEPLAEIVPRDDTLLVEARVRPADIAFLRPGQDARVKITAYDFAVYGTLDGTVERISPDAIVDEDGNSFYEMRVRTAETALGRPGQERQPIMPGMVAEVNVLTGKRTVLDYLLNPLIRVRDQALREG